MSSLLHWLTKLHIYNVGAFCKRDIVARRTGKKIITAATKENRTEEKDIWRLYANPNCRAVGYIRACENIVYNINQYTCVVRLPTSIYSIIDVVLLKNEHANDFYFPFLLDFLSLWFAVLIFHFYWTSLRIRAIYSFVFNLTLIFLCLTSFQRRPINFLLCLVML